MTENENSRYPAAPGSADFLPICRAEMEARGWDAPDFVYVTGDAYVDHPSFGAAIISRVLEADGFRVAILSQPDWHSAEPFREFGRPKLGFLVTAGNIDSMVAHYTVAGNRRKTDYYSPGGEMGKRPNRATIVYCNRIREAFGDVPIILGGLEASLRRFAHYDYWDDQVRRSLLIDSGADMLTYGMGENILRRVAGLLRRGVPIGKIRDVRGTCFTCTFDELNIGSDLGTCAYQNAIEAAEAAKILHYPAAPGGCFDFDSLSGGDEASKEAYAQAFSVQYRNQDAIYGKAILEVYRGVRRVLVQNPPMPPLEREELDRVYALPYTRTYHPSYEKMGGVPAIGEVRFSITHNRGCYGACNFCALAFHQGRTVRSRSIESVVAEARLLTALPDFKGYIHDVGGPTANFRGPACAEQLERGVCPNRKCLAPTPCKNLRADHSEYVALLSAVEALPGVKKVFIRSGIRFDYLLADPDDTFFRKLVRDHVSGQLKVAPEHCSDGVLRCMGKPDFAVYERFRKRYFELSREAGKEQYLVPYLMSSHPGSTLNDAVDLALCLARDGYEPEQVQDYYPTPGTASTVMYYTGLDPLSATAASSMKKVHVVRDPHEKRLQRALLQFNNPKNADLVREALEKTGRQDAAALLLRAGKPKRQASPARPTSERPDSPRPASAHSTRPTRKPQGPADRNRNLNANGQGQRRTQTKPQAKPQTAPSTPRHTHKTK